MSEVSQQGRSLKGVWIGAGIALFVVACVAAWKLRPFTRPPASGDPVTLAKFVASSDFDRLTEPQKRPYRAALRSKSKELASALQGGRLSREQYDEAYLNGWLSRQIDHMGDFFTLPVANREQAWAERYLNE